MDYEEKKVMVSASVLRELAEDVIFIDQTKFPIMFEDAWKARKEAIRVLQLAELEFGQHLFGQGDDNA